MICTIYLLTNNVNNKIYIGQTWNPFNIRMGKDGSNYKNSIYLYNAIQKYGVENFTYTILAYCENQIDADKTESIFINLYNSKDLYIGYNLKSGGSVGKHSQETKDKISESIKNKIWSENALLNKAKGGKAWKGKKRGSQTKDRIIQTIEAMKKWHANNKHPMFGKHHSESAKNNISKKLTGMKRDIESVKQGALKRMMSVEREQAIIDAYISGITIKQIIFKFKTGNAGVYRVLKRNNIQLSSNKK